MEEISNERYELIKTEIKKAQKNGDFKTEIFLAERCGFYFYAGKISRLHGLFKDAYEDFKKGKKENPWSQKSCLEGINEIKQVLNPNQKKYLKIKIYEEKYDKGNWDGSFWSRTEENLINHLERSQERQNSCSRIRFCN